MAGHSKWANTKRHKALIDAKKGKIFSSLSKDITMAARSGGGDPEFNPRLRTLINKAKASNMPGDNIERAVMKGTGELPGVVYEEYVYEAYGPGGVGLIIEVTTENKNRSVAAVRAALTKSGHEMAKPGALAFNFAKMGQFFISKEKIDEDTLMALALDLGAEDIKTEGDAFEVRCAIADYDRLSHGFEKAKIVPDASELAWVPNTLTPVTDPDTAKSVLKLIDALEELEDVQNVYSNLEVSDSLLA